MKARGISGQISIEEFLAGMQRPPESPVRAPERPKERKKARRQPTVPPHVKSFLRGGAGRPGARLKIEQAITGNPELSYEPTRTAVAELAGAAEGGVEVHRRGVLDRSAGWSSWPLVIAWISEEVKSGTWLSPGEREQEEEACRLRKPKRGWNL